MFKTRSGRRTITIAPAFAMLTGCGASQTGISGTFPQGMIPSAASDVNPRKASGDFVAQGQSSPQGRAGAPGSCQHLHSMDVYGAFIPSMQASSADAMAETLGRHRRIKGSNGLRVA